MTTAPKNLRPAAALWDMDGTIIDTEPLWLVAETGMLARYGIELPSDLEQKLIGSGLTAAAEYFRELGVPMSVDEIIDEWATAVIAGLRSSEPQWMPGALELLTEFRAAGIPNALVTMSVRSIADVVVALLPADTFDAIVTGDAVDHEKPHPEPYLRGAEALGVRIEDCIAFEDSYTGTTAAAASGAFAVGVPNLLSLEGSDAHTVLPTLSGVDIDEAARLWRAHREQLEGEHHND